MKKSADLQRSLPILVKYRFAMGRDWPGGFSLFSFHFTLETAREKIREKSEERREQKETTIFFGKPSFLFGDPLGIRTPDPLLKRQLLCQLS